MSRGGAGQGKAFGRSIWQLRYSLRRHVGMECCTQVQPEWHVRALGGWAGVHVAKLLCAQGAGGAATTRMQVGVRQGAG